MGCFVVFNHIRLSNITRKLLNYRGKCCLICRPQPLSHNHSCHGLSVKGWGPGLCPNTSEVKQIPISQQRPPSMISAGSRAGKLLGHLSYVCNTGRNCEARDHSSVLVCRSEGRCNLERQKIRGGKNGRGK